MLTQLEWILWPLACVGGFYIGAAIDRWERRVTEREEVVK